MTIADCRSNKGTVRKKHRTFYVLAAFCYNLKFLYRFFFEITNMISIKVLISIEIARFIPKCKRCFVDLAFTFSCMLNTLIFTVDSYILKKAINVPLGLSQLQSSILLMNTISIYHIVKCVLSYYIIQQFQKKLFFFNQASWRLSNLSDTHRLKSMLLAW